MITRQMEQDFIGLVRKYDGAWQFRDFEDLLFKNRDKEKVEFVHNDNDLNPRVFVTNSDKYLEVVFRSALPKNRKGKQF